MNRFNIKNCDSRSNTFQINPESVGESNNSSGNRNDRFPQILYE